MLCKKKLFLEISQELHQQLLEVVAQRYSVKKVFLEMSKNSQENTCARVSFLIIRLWHRCFPVIFAKFLRAPFLREHHLWWLLLNFIKKESLAQVLSCESCEISKNTFFTEHLRTTASEIIH